MPKYIFRSIPTISFAHRFRDENYSNTIPAQQSSIEITYIYEGCLNVISDGQKYEVKRGCIFCNPCKHPMKVESDGVHEHHTVCLTADFGFFDDSDGSADPAAAEIPYVIHPNRSHSAEIHGLINRLISGHTIYDPLYNAGLILQLISELNRCSESRKKDGSAIYSEKAKKYISDHISDPITQTEIAEYLSITPEYLCSVFRKNEGITVKGYMNKIKLSYLRDLMLREGITLKAASELCGYSDPNYVSRLYAKTFHTTVTESIKKTRDTYFVK